MCTTDFVKNGLVYSCSVVLGADEYMPLGLMGDVKELCARADVGDVSNGELEEICTVRAVLLVDVVIVLVDARLLFDGACVVEPPIANIVLLFSSTATSCVAVLAQLLK